MRPEMARLTLARMVQSAGRHIQRMQKTLTQMNIQMANVLSDVSGVTGQAIIQAILADAIRRSWRRFVTLG